MVLKGDVRQIYEGEIHHWLLVMVTVLFLGLLPDDQAFEDSS